MSTLNTSGVMNESNSSDHSVNDLNTSGGKRKLTLYCTTLFTSNWLHFQYFCQLFLNICSFFQAKCASPLSSLYLSNKGWESIWKNLFSHADPLNRLSCSRIRLLKLAGGQSIVTNFRLLRRNISIFYFYQLKRD